MDLHQWQKKNTNPTIFKKEFLTIRNKYYEWEFVFTDGSKTDTTTAFSVVQENFNILKMAILPYYTSVFGAEMEAIFWACIYAQKHKRKTIICSDSLSVISAINNINNTEPTVNKIRDILSNNKTLKLLWIPSHFGICGNEKADELAKFATKAPLITAPFYNSKDIKRAANSIVADSRTQNWNNYTHFYKHVNPNKTPPLYPTTVSRREAVTFTRFRIGHTRLTNKYLFELTGKPPCVLCNNDNMSVNHLTSQCESARATANLMGIPNLQDLLSSVNEANIKSFSKFLKRSNIFYEI